MYSLNNPCNKSGCGFPLDMIKANVASNLPCQGKDKDLTHTLDNIYIIYYVAVDSIAVVNRF